MAVDFSAKQLEFTRYIRDPATQTLPADVKPERMMMYRELIFNNIDGFLAGNFPVIRQILTDDAWQAMVQDFFVSHRSSTPYFAEIAGEFLDYLQNERNNPDDYPFLLELAHYEWVEMALSIAKDDAPQPTEVTDWQAYQIGLSPLAWPLIYSYPVHKISPDFIPDSPSNPPICLVVFRNQYDEIKFSEINLMTYRLLELIQEQQPVSTQNVLNQVVAETPNLMPNVVTQGGLDIIKDLVAKGIVATTMASFSS